MMAKLMQSGSKWGYANHPDLEGLKLHEQRVLSTEAWGRGLTS